MCRTMTFIGIVRRTTMFTKLELRSWIKIIVARCRSTQKCFQGLREACSDAALPYYTMAWWVKVFWEGRDAVQGNLCTRRPHMENNSVQLLASLLFANCQWIERELAAEVGVCHKTVLHILHDILGYRKLATHWLPHKISEVQQWHCYAVAQALLDQYQREGDEFLGRIITMDETWDHSFELHLKCQSNEWKHLVLLVQTKCTLHNVPWRWCSLLHMILMGNTAPCCISKANHGWLAR